MTAKVTELDDAPAKPAKGKAAAPAHSDPATDTNFAAEFRNEKRSIVVVATGDGDEGKRPVELGIQGHVLRFPRNTKVSLPESYVQALRDIVISETDPTTGERHERPRYAFSVLGPDTSHKPAAVAA